MLKEVKKNKLIINENLGNLFLELKNKITKIKIPLIGFLTE